MNIQRMTVGDGLRTRELRLLNLRDEVVKEFGLGSKYRKLIPKSEILVTNNGVVVGVRHVRDSQSWLDVFTQNIPAVALHASEPATQELATFPGLSQTKKIRHYRFWSTVTGAGGLPQRRYTNTVLKLYRAVHVDTAPYLSVPDMWLTVPAFQGLLTEYLPKDGFRCDLRKVGSEWVPEDQVVEHAGNRYVKEGLVGARLLFKYDVVKNRWTLWD